MAQLWAYSRQAVTVTASTAATLLELIPGAGTNIKIKYWNVSFNQFNAAQPVEVFWINSSTAMTSPTAITAQAVQPGQGTARGAANTPGTENYTVSGIAIETDQVPITSGEKIQYQYAGEIWMPQGTTSFRLRMSPGTTGGTADIAVWIEE